jgi:hypothetical protein
MKPRSTRKKQRSGSSTRKKQKPAGESRVTKIVEQQEAAIRSFATFMQKSAQKTLQGNFNPSELVKDYAVMWKDWAKQFAAITREVLRD